MSDNRFDDKFKVDQRIAVAVYKWLKIAQSLILVALGIIFAACSASAMKSGSDSSFFGALPVCIGVVLSIFGLLDVLAGYYLHRNLMSEEILLGSLSISASIVLFVKSAESVDLLSEVLSIFIVMMLFVYAVLCVIYGVDRILGKKGLTKNVPFAVFSFIGAVVLLGLGIAYLVLQNKYASQISQLMFLVVGLVLIVLGFVSFVSLLMKVRATNKALKLEEQKRESEEETRKEDMNAEVKVVELDELKRERRRDRKVFNREKIGETQAFSLDEEGNLIDQGDTKKIGNGK